MDLGFIAGANTAGLTSGMDGLRTSHSHQESGSQGIRDTYASNKDPPGFFVEAPRSFLGNATHFSGSEYYDSCTDGLDVYRLLDQEGNNYQARKDHLKDDYRRALEDARHGTARTTVVDVREIIPCEYCMEDISRAYLDGEFLPTTNLDVSDFDITV